MIRRSIIKEKCAASTCYTSFTTVGNAVTVKSAKQGFVRQLKPKFTFKWEDWLNTYGDIDCVRIINTLYRKWQNIIDFWKKCLLLRGHFEII